MAARPQHRDRSRQVRWLSVAIGLAVAAAGLGLAGDRLLIAAVDRALARHVESQAMDWIARRDVGRDGAAATALPSGVLRLRLWDGGGALLLDSGPPATDEAGSADEADIRAEMDPEAGTDPTLRRDAQSEAPSNVGRSAVGPPSRDDAASRAQGNTTSRAQGDATSRAQGDATSHAQGDAAARAQGDATSRAQGDAAARARADIPSPPQSDAGPGPQARAVLAAGGIVVATHAGGDRVGLLIALPPPPSAAASGATEAAPAVADLIIDVAAARSTLRYVLRQGAGVLGSLALAVLVGAGLIWLGLMRRVRRAEHEVQQQARLDPLTGLANRAGFAADVAMMAEEEPDGRGGGRLALICLDVDRFKAVNEAQGHGAGDALLCAVATALRGALRRDDAVARLGADEFAVAARVRGPADLDALLARLPRRLGGIGAGPGMVTASFGALLVRTEEIDLDAALGKAEIALAEAKTEGGGAARLFSPEMETRVRRHRRIEHCIRSGLAEGRFTLAYQPVVGRRDRRTHGAEALMRLIDMDGAPIPPSDFIPVAEATGAIVELGAWAIRTAAAEALRWPAPLRVSVNLSARQFRDGRLPETVRAALSDTGLPAARLELEVTESLLIADPEAVSAQLAALRDLGVSIAMDDFGAGYSSLAYLWRFGFDRLKLDRSFVLALAADERRARDVIAAIVALGHRLGLSVTAEGIETETEALALSDLGCDEMQGYHFGRPMPAADLREVLRWSELPPGPADASCAVWGADWAADMGGGWGDERQVAVRGA